MKRKIKKAVRDVLNDSPHLPVDVVAVAEARGIKVRKAPLEASVSGMLVIKDGGAIIAVNQEHHPHRQRFSLAHELGHYELHKNESRVFIDDNQSRAFYRDGLSSKGVDPKEVEANAFAAELLMPEQLVIHAVGEDQIDPSDEETVRKLAHKFGVSVQAMSIRLASLGKFILGESERHTAHLKMSDANSQHV